VLFAVTSAGEGPQGSRSHLQRLRGQHKLARTVASFAVAIAGVAGITTGLVVQAAPALADDFVPVPANGIFSVTGHGFGHGIGMSQYGAFGAAQKGLTASQILSFYYPGTTQQQVGNPPIRVHLTAYDSSGVTMVAPPGQQMTVTDQATGATANGPTAMYKVQIDATAMHILFLDPSDQTWKPFMVGTTADTAGPVTFTTPVGVRMYNADGTSRQYRGSIRVVRLSAATAAAVNVLDMQSYLYGVVPREMPDSWALPAALQSQAVAARSYALSVATPTAAWDICDTTACQVYGGQATVAANGTVTAIEGVNASPAVDATNGVALYFQGAPAFTQFSASNGGQVAPGARPYLVAEADPYDTAAIDPNHDWTAQITAAALQAAYPSVGTVQGLQVTSRDGAGDFGGRIVAVQVVGSNATVSTNTYLGLKSNYWTAGGGPSTVPVILNRGTAIGHLEAAGSAGPGILSVKGWSFNSISKEVPDFVDVYIDNVLAGRLPANQSRPDVGAAYGNTSPYHGFSGTFQTTGGTHTVCVKGIDGVTNPTLNCTSATLPSGNPFGNLESVTDIGTGVQLTGWAIDPDTANPATVHVYVDGVWSGATTANVERDDVGNAYPGYTADHGFSIVVKPGQGTHSICAYAINIGIGTTNPLLKCATITLNRNPRGGVSLASVTNGVATVTGWALDPDVTGPIAVHLYLDGVWAGMTTANLDGATQAAAINPVYGTLHGFSISAKLTPGLHTLCAYGINVGAGSTNPSLGCVQITGDGNPIGNLDQVTKTATGWVAAGWSIDPDSNDSIPVDVYVDGKLVIRTTADAGRADIAAIYSGWGPDHGFDAPITLSAGKHQICAYGINTGPGTTNPSLGCATVHA
jgi:SpoIID/LytB domain protein